MRPLPSEQQLEMLTSLRAWSGCTSAVREQYRPMTAPEVRRLRDGNLVTIGAHTISHPILSGLTVANQKNEIFGSRDLLQEITGEPVISFAYPYGGGGDYTAESVDVVRQAGFDCAFSTASGLIRKDSDHMRLPRIWVRNWNADKFAYRLHEWML
jgi:peptidoglycan/xylan/chitin deacetylase (PgdA/CDA1 family)